MKSQREILAENLNRLIGSRGIDQKELAAHLGVTEMAVSHWVKGNKYPRIDKIQQMADYFRVNKSDLIEEKLPGNLLETSQHTTRIPILGIISCGDPILAEQNFENYRTVLSEGLPTGRLVYLEAKGDSMAPTIPNGAMVMIREQPDVENGEIAAVLLNGNQEATLKRVKKQNNLVILMPDNSAYDPIFVDESQPAKIIGKAIRFEQDL